MAISQGPFAPGTLADDNTVGTDPWDSPANAAASDNVYCSAIMDGPRIPATVVSHYLKLTNFGFAIPTGSTIVGVVVNVEHDDAESGASTFTEHGARLYVAGYTGSTKIFAKSLTETTAAVGVVADLWSAALTAANVTASTFGVGIYAQSNHDAADNGNGTCAVDAVTMTVYYLNPVPSGVVFMYRKLKRWWDDLRPRWMPSFPALPMPVYSQTRRLAVRS